MSIKIDRLQVNNFRGIRHIDLEVAGKNLIIYGENGSGKSSVIDAIEYLFTKTVGKLSGRADVSEKVSIPHLKGGATCVEMSFKGISAAVAVPYPARKVKLPTVLRPYFDLAGDHPFILRRSQILAFINAKPAGRYSEISKIVGLGELDAIDVRWRRERNKLQQEVKRVSDRLQDKYQKLSEVLDHTVRTQNELVDEVSSQLRVCGLEPVRTREQIAARCKALENELRSDGDQATATNLQSLLNEAEIIRASLQDCIATGESLAATLQEFWQHSSVLEGASWESLLNEGHRLLSAVPDQSSCPLCEAAIPDMSDLLQRLQVRINELQKITTLRQKIQGIASQLGAELSNLQQWLTGLLEGLKESDLHGDGAVMIAGMKALGAWQAALQAGQFSGQMVEKWRKSEAVASLSPALEKVEYEIQQRCEALAFSNRDLELSQLYARLIRVDENWRDLEATIGKANRLDHLYQQMILVYNELIAARQRGIEHLRQELESDFERYYELLHPDEGYDKISIVPQTEKRSSVDLTAEFHGHKPAHPLNFYSEGHLDSLGLCIFLAFIKHFNGELRLIALDDVLTTVDAGHRLRVARLLAKEFDKYQLIITTHDQMWAKQLERVLPNSRLITLKRWSLESGADYIQNVISAWDHYRQQAQQGYPQDAIAGTARNLEKFFFQMRGNLALAVPAKHRGDYTINDLYGPFFKWLKDHPIVRPDRPNFARELSATQEALGEIWPIRNWAGAHFNEWAETVTSEEAVDFVDTVRDLVALFECPACTNLVAYNRAAQALICPVCRPQPPVQINLEYDAGWYGRATRMLNRNRAQSRINALDMTISQFTYFLRDMRHHAGLSVPARQDGAYTDTDLYPPFLEWARAHPRSGAGQKNWAEKLMARHRAILAFRQDGRWDVSEQSLAAFVTTIHQFISLFCCDRCSQLLAYEAEHGNYFCATCNGQQSADPTSAYWFISNSK